jgi:hypothetical protein
VNEKASRESFLASSQLLHGSKGTIYDGLLQLHDLSKFLDRVKILPLPNQALML